MAEIPHSPLQVLVAPCRNCLKPVEVVAEQFHGARCQRCEYRHNSIADVEHLRMKAKLRDPWFELPADRGGGVKFHKEYDPGSDFRVMKPQTLDVTIYADPADVPAQPSATEMYRARIAFEAYYKSVFTEHAQPRWEWCRPEDVKAWVAVAEAVCEQFLYDQN